MADNATECAKAGNYNSDDEKIIMLKARTIIKCFINSELPPRVRVRRDCSSVFAALNPPTLKWLW